jgi:hypothetical protein
VGGLADVSLGLRALKKNRSSVMSHHASL